MNNGLHDLFVSHYAAYDLNDLPAFGSMVNCLYHTIKVQCGPAGLKGSPDSLYHNNGDGTYTDVSKRAGVDDPHVSYNLATAHAKAGHYGEAKPQRFHAGDVPRLGGVGGDDAIPAGKPCARGGLWR